MGLNLPNEFERIYELVKAKDGIATLEEHQGRVERIDTLINEMVSSLMKNRYDEFHEFFAMVVDAYGDWDGTTSASLERRKENYANGIGVSMWVVYQFSGKDEVDVIDFVQNMLKRDLFIRPYEYVVSYLLPAINAMVDNEKRYNSSLFINEEFEEGNQQKTNYDSLKKWRAMFDAHHNDRGGFTQNLEHTKEFLFDPAMVKFARAAIACGALKTIFRRRHRMYRLRFKATLYAMLYLQVGDVVEVRFRSDYPEFPTRVRISEILRDCHGFPNIEVGPVLFYPNGSYGIHDTFALATLYGNAFLPVVAWKRSMAAEFMTSRFIGDRDMTQPGVVWKIYERRLLHIFQTRLVPQETFDITHPYKIGSRAHDLERSFEHNAGQGEKSMHLQTLEFEHLLIGFKVYCMLILLSGVRTSSPPRSLLDLVLEQVCPEFHFYWKLFPQ